MLYAGSVGSSLYPKDMDTLPEPRDPVQEARGATLSAFVALGRAITLLPLEHPAAQELEEARLAVDVALTELRES